MKGQSHILIGIVFYALISCKTAEKEGGEIQNKPNLLIVLSDQHSYDMLGAFGNDQVITPNLDQFASEGIRFDMAFSNQPVCTPFRGMLLSGMHPLNNGAFVNDTPLLPNKSKLLAEVLKANGYQTAYVGKWHLLGGNRDRPIPSEMRYGFDTVLTNNCHVDFRPGKAFFWNAEGNKEYFEKWEVYGQTDQAMQLLDSFDKEKPFALIVSWHPPHDWGKFKGTDGKMHYRYDTLEELMELYERDSINLRSDLQSTPDTRRMYHGHMAMISGVDRAFGLLLDKLEKIEATENTLTIFSADHGDMLESFGARLPKQYPHDYSARIPLMMRYPQKLKKGTTTNLLIGALDFMPTILGLMDIETQQNYDGTNLATAILNEDEHAQQFIPTWVYRTGVNVNEAWRGVITKEFSFAYSNENELDASPLFNVLFDRKNDPDQRNNLFWDSNYDQVKDSLKLLTQKWMKKYDDTFYTAGDFKRIQPKEGWAQNRVKSPFELFREHHKESDLP
ncbi:MAG: sulfatase-like hydrolase/transferase [Flagellimonas sp.]